MNLVEKFAFHQWQVCLHVMGLQPIPRMTLLNLLIRLSWLGYHCYWLVTVVFLQVSSGIPIGYIVGFMMFTFNSLSCIVVTLESAFCWPRQQRLDRLKQRLDVLFVEHLDCDVSARLAKAQILMRAFKLGILHFITDVIKIWIKGRRQVTPVFWQAFVMMIVNRCRYLQIILIVLEMNNRVLWLKEELVKCAQANAPKSIYSSEVWRPYTDQEYARVNVLRLIYGQIHEIYTAINDCFGWSLLTIFLASFFDFVSNAFWAYEAGFSHETFELFIYNGCTTIALASLIIILFWCTHASQTNSRHIGCLIYKLVKPLGNKRYNDLVSEFSLQALHQQFEITAKEFFTLNLSLLGAMVAAIITYLVILIQFMFTENKTTVALNSTKATIGNN